MRSGVLNEACPLIVIASQKFRISNDRSIDRVPLLAPRGRRSVMSQAVFIFGGFSWQTPSLSVQPQEVEGSPTYLCQLAFQLSRDPVAFGVKET